jgi:hypothetical protein
MSTKTECTVCQKEIKGYEIYGPFHWPLCWECLGEHEGAVLDIIKNEKSFNVARSIRALADPGARKAREEARRVEKEIVALEEEIDDLEWHLRDAKSRLHRLRHEAMAAIPA